jgi:nitrate reductase cytochrome c-type subunit
MFMAAVGLAQIDPLLGSHNLNSQGCLTCHAPHNALPGKGAYLWAGAIPTSTYSTYITSDGNGGTLNAATMSAGLTNAISSPVANLPMAHTVLCLSCHDTTFNTGMATAITGSTTKGLNFNIGANESLSGDHPVDIIYPANNPKYFTAKVNVGTYTVQFNDSLYAYGHPTKLYTDGTNAYVECSTCHNPHSQRAVVVSNIGGIVPGAVMSAVCTTHFIRGQYEATNETATGAAPAATGCPTPTTTTYQTDNANFCMSCHSYPSNQFTGLPH